MEFKRNEKYIEQRARMTVLKDEYALKYQAVSEVYWPRYDRYKKVMKDRIYLITCASILVVLVTVWVILGGIRNEYLIGGAYLISLGLLAWAIIAFIRKKKEREFFLKEWEKENNEVKAISDEIKELGDSMVEEMIMIMCYNDYHYDGVMDNWEENYKFSLTTSSCSNSFCGVTLPSLPTLVFVLSPVSVLTKLLLSLGSPSSAVLSKP